jgi:ABC-type polysaccharide/polyol phosphate export permease
MKCVPCSLIKTLGHPNLVITCSNRKCVVVSTLQSFTGVASAHLVSYSVAVIMYLAPVLFSDGLVPQSLLHIYRMPTMLPMVVMESRPFYWVYQPFDRHRISGSTPSSLCE